MCASPTMRGERRAAGFGAALLVSLPFALLETEAIRWHPDPITALAWSVLALTLGQFAAVPADPARRGHAGHQPALPRAAVHGGDGLALFGEAFTPLMMMGMALTAIGVALVVRDGR